MEFTYITCLPDKEKLYNLYEELDWNAFLKLDADHLLRAMKNSYLSVYVYDGDKLIGTGRVVSDGVINAYLCGLGVKAEYRRNGIASGIVEMIKERCREDNLHLQLVCDEELVDYYEKRGFEKFTIGMKAKM